MLIDTHRAVRDLTEGDTSTEAQAEKMVAIVTRADDQVATKGDIQNLKEATQKDLKAFRWQVIVGTSSMVVAILAIFEFVF